MTSANLPQSQPEMSESSEPNPIAIWDAINAHQQTAAMRAAIELEVFTVIGQEPKPAAAIADRCQASERGIRILCDFLTVQGLLTKHEGRYGLTPNSATFLDKHSPAYMGDVVRFINSPELLSAFDNMTEVVRQGKSQMPGAGTVDPDDPVWVEFARSMVPMVAPAAEYLGELAVKNVSGRLRVLDIAAGHGLFGIAIARRHPEAEIVAVDWANVLEVARENAEAAGVQNRYQFLPGDAFEVDFGTGFDLVLLTNFLHHFDPPTCEQLLKKIHACLNPTGRVMTLEFVPNEDRISPPLPATFSLIMLATTPSGDAYTFQEFDRMFRASGFERNELQEIPQSPSQIIISHR